MLRRILSFFIFLFILLNSVAFAQTNEELEFNLDLNSATVSLPKIYKPSIDLSGRGVVVNKIWPQTLASKDSLDTWQKDLNFNNFYRLQYNLWEIQQLANDSVEQEKLFNSYEEVIKRISDSGGTVILNLFGTPFGLGRVLDKNSAPHDLRAYKELVKKIIRKLSCEKKYNIWYEVWNAPDLGDFFLGERSEYFNLYRSVGEAVKELRRESKINIPLGGPSVSAWFRNLQPNTILSPENSLIYELIKYCYNYRLPLDFISWHAYSSDPQEDKQDTIYNKSTVKLIREWLSYFHFDSQLPLIIDEWNFDGAANMLSERCKSANIAASYIPARLKNMWEAQIDYQTYFCLEDFGGNRGAVTRNLGVATFDLGRKESKSYPKSSYNLFRLLNLLGENLFTSGLNDDFVGVIATKSEDYIAVMIYNYLDQQAAMNYLSRNIVYLNSNDRKSLLSIVKSDRLEKVLIGKLDLVTLRLGSKAKEMLISAIELNNAVNKFSTMNRKLKITIKGIEDLYVLNKYIIDNKCSRDCEFKVNEEKDIDFAKDYIETLELAPYSVQLLVFKKKVMEAKTELKVVPVKEKAEVIENKNVEDK
ncbi:MAG: cellulase family glycosylhydrolase [Candidatus Omnitrophota bacterium]